MAEFDDKSWHSKTFKERIIAQIDGAREQAKECAEIDENTKPSSEMEDFIFQKAQNREEYMALIARLIMYFREKSKAASNFDSVEISSAQRDEVNKRLAEVKDGAGLTDE